MSREDRNRGGKSLIDYCTRGVWTTMVTKEICNALGPFPIYAAFD
jgi:hypothetical protein